MNIKPYTDVYFLRAVQILEYFELNPMVRAQIFIRKGFGMIAGIAEITELIRESSDFFKNGGQILSLRDGERYGSGETLIVLEGRAQDVIPLETVILGILSSRTTQLNDRIDVNLQQVTSRVREIRELIGNRSLLYFGARHWHYSQDRAIAEAAFAGGANAASTDAGSSVTRQKGVGTIPHSLENIFAWKHGAERTVVETAKAFNEAIDESIPRIALVDYNNRELDDSLEVAKALGEELTGVRVDTSGENIMQGALESGPHEPAHFWYGPGVTISGVRELRRALKAFGYEELKIVLSSGFGDIARVEAFVNAEKELGVKLFDSLGVGNLFNARIATMDIVEVGETLDSLQPIAKKGRVYKPNTRLRVLK